MEIFFSLSGLFNAVTSTLLGLLIYTRNPQNKVNKSFALFCLCVAAWSYPYTFWPIAKDAQTTLFWFQTLHIGACYASIAYLYFVSTWLGVFQKVKKLIIAGFFIATFFAYFVFSPFFISGMTPKFSMKFWAEPGILYHFYLLMFFSYALTASYLLVINYKKTSGVRRAQIKYILLGMVLTYIGGSTNYPLWYGINLPPYGNILASAYVILSAYAIVTRHLMDIKFALRRSFVYLSSLVTLVLPIICIQYLAIIFYNDLIDVVTVVLIIIAVLIFSPLKHYYYRLANKYFFSSLYDSQEVIAKLSEKLRSSIDVQKNCSAMTGILIDSFHCKKAGVLIFDEKNHEYQAAYNHGFQIGDQKTFVNDKILHSLFITKNKPIIIEEIKGSIYKKTKATIDLLKSLEIEILTPLNIKNKNIGLIAIGSKESGDIYNSEDMCVLEVVGAQGAVALENALLYEESLAFGRKLKMEVTKATKDLRSANKRLIDLDKTKTEFISVASHQLRTPLSGIKGHLSMMIDGDYGKMQAKQKRVIREVYDNNERLVRLVNVFLNISRIESGRLTLSQEKVQLEDLIDKAVYQMETAARAKGLYLKFNKPPKKLPELNLDRDKMLDVILNLIDNAIKYTIQGGMAVDVSQDKYKILVKVKDTGVGIDKAQLAKLFSKFIRGIDASKMSTTGSGLGLFIAKKIIELHKGKIWGESQGTGKGSVFTFELPIK